jgi:hypothetical protein
MWQLPYIWCKQIKGLYLALQTFDLLPLLVFCVRWWTKIIVEHFINYVLEHHIITEHQSGFQPKDSTVNQLVYIYNTIISNLDIGKDIRFIFCDISKSFDRVWHTGLLYKLRKIGIGEPQHQFYPTQMRIHLRKPFVSYHLNNL